MNIPPSPPTSGSNIVYPDRPIFYNAPWAPFKSRTGDSPIEPAPAGTAIPEPEPVTPKLCPFRKRIFFMEDVRGGPIECIPENANFMEEEFLHCLEEKCMLYQHSRREGPYCGRMNKGE